MLCSLRSSVCGVCSYRPPHPPPPAIWAAEAEGQCPMRGPPGSWRHWRLAARSALLAAGGCWLLVVAGCWLWCYHGLCGHGHALLCAVRFSSELIGLLGPSLLEPCAWGPRSWSRLEPCASGGLAPPAPAQGTTYCDSCRSKRKVRSTGQSWYPTFCWPRRW
jgi:hypothetical protein